MKINIESLKKIKVEGILGNIAIIYFLVGFLFATLYAIYYRWEAWSFLSPGFYSVTLTWPIQLPGFVSDLSYFGWAGKSL